MNKIIIHKQCANFNHISGHQTRSCQKLFHSPVSPPEGHSGAANFIEAETTVALYICLALYNALVIFVAERDRWFFGSS